MKLLMTMIAASMLLGAPSAHATKITTEGKSPYYTTMDEAVAAAQPGNQTILLKFYAVW